MSVPITSVITTMLLCVFLLSGCRPQLRDKKEDSSGACSRPTENAIISEDKNELGGSSADESGQSEGKELAIRPVPALAFGQEAWAQYFGDVGEAPPLPEDIASILDRSCPFWEDKKVRDTHLLTLIPAKVDDSNFSLNLLGELITRPQNNGYRAQYDYNTEDTQRLLGSYAPGSSYWVLMTRDVLPGSRSLRDIDQGSLVTNNHARRTGLPYAPPTALEAATTILMHYTRTGEHLFTNGKDGPTYTFCHESVPRLSDPPRRRAMYIGNFSAGKLNINCYTTGVGMFDYTLHSHGVAACRKL